MSLRFDFKAMGTERLAAFYANNRFPDRARAIRCLGPLADRTPDPVNTVNTLSMMAYLEQDAGPHRHLAMAEYAQLRALLPAAVRRQVPK